MGPVNLIEFKGIPLLDLPGRFYLPLVEEIALIIFNDWKMVRISPAEYFLLILTLE
jgi:hypothetical protein